MGIRPTHFQIGTITITLGLSRHRTSSSVVTSLLLFSSVRGRQLLNCLVLRLPIGPNALPLIHQLIIEIS